MAHIIGKLDRSEVDHILQELSQYDDQSFEGQVTNGKQGQTNYDARVCKLFFPKTIDAPFTHHIIQELLLEYIYPLDYSFVYPPEVQYTIYTEGGFFKWHSDIITPKKNSPIRAFTFSVNLNDSYTGGGIEMIDKETSETIKLSKEPGSWIMFPAHYRHRALPVETGVRKAMVIWPHIEVHDIKRYRDDEKNNIGHNLLQQS